MNEISHFCKICGSVEAKKNGFVSGFQRYKCKQCGHQYIKMTDRGKPTEEKLRALTLYSFGVSKNFIAHILNVTAPSIGRWIEHFKEQKLIDSNTPHTEQNIETVRLLNANEISNELTNAEKLNPAPFHVYTEKLDSNFEINLIIKDISQNNNTENLNTNRSFCAFGDSILRGVVRDTTQDKYKILRNNLLDIFSTKSDITYKNYAKHGNTVIDGDLSFDVHLSEVKQSDCVFLLFGGNESNFDWDAISANPTSQHKPTCSLTEFHNKYTFLINKIKKQNKTPILFSLPPINANKYFDFICRNRNKNNILTFLQNDIQVIYRWHEMYNLAIFKIAHENNVQLVDITSEFLNHKVFSDLLCEDGIHPNEAGHALIAKIIRDIYQQNEKRN